MEGNKTGLQPSTPQLNGEYAEETAELGDIDYPITQLDQLLNDLQGNAAVAAGDDGLARFGESRLRAIRTNALAQSAAAWLAEQALRDVMQGTDAWTGTQSARVLFDHQNQLREESLRWRLLAERAATYLLNPELAREHARHWLGESCARDEYPGL
ncbi:hypothetical protein [Dyella tabacisoli]|uniref:Uncharacterized protein n=1 Tax=Dyella tabacisoli TaxID=2282381 RepID=A0A369UTH5_9GAMM|nr:hypothetical protein [Dyella tabacisoli]RDD82900.1 hypothetical protein DVJ77_05140 [Dyella tabacisoli]